MKPAQPRMFIRGVPLVAMAIVIAAAGAVSARRSVAGRQSRAAQDVRVGRGEFVEPGFPYIVSTVDARGLGGSFPAGNVATRGVVLMLGDSTYAVFDPDLLRMAIAWRGESLPMTTMAQVSYRDSLNKNNDIPRVPGRPLFGTGIYPGWMAGEPDFRDPRPLGENAEDPGRGPLPASAARWEGIYLVGEQAVLAYVVDGTAIRELPERLTLGGETAVARTIRVARTGGSLTLVAAERAGEGHTAVEANVATLFEASGDTVTAVGLVDAPRGAHLKVVDDRYAVVELEGGTRASTFRVVTWRGPASRLERFRQMLSLKVRMPAFERGGPARWRTVVTTSGEIAPDTAAYVVDEVGLPLANPWGRNVRPSDIAFFDDGRAAVSTFEGDVWIVDELDADLAEVEWRRFASGLYEPMSLEIVDDEVYVYSRSGLVRPRDLNRDGEADFYENFSDLPVQTVESREFPLSMGSRPGGGFILSKGAALDNGPRTAPATFPGFRAGSPHAGAVVEISPDGRSIRTIATGLREPFVGVRPGDGTLTASDQQGNFVPSTPVYRIEQDGYYGVPASAHRQPLPDTIEEAVVWIPHEVDQSAAGQTWVKGGTLGFAEDALIHLSYGRPGAFRVYFDDEAQGWQGAVVSLSDDFAAPILKAEQHPRDGSLYLVGFQIWGTRSKGIRTMARLRRTGAPSTLPEAVRIGEQGVLLRFGVPLDAAVAGEVSRYSVARWNYQRSSQYGSGHFKPDGTPGEEVMGVASAHLAEDGRSLLVVLPDMREVMQLRMAYDLEAADGTPVSDTLYLTVNRVASLDLTSAGFGDVDWRTRIAAAAGMAPTAEAGDATPALGKVIFERVGCFGCHSVDGSTAGKPGPTLKGLYGRDRPLADGSRARADEAYLRRSIESPGAQIAQGFQEGMPAYLGVLSDEEIESVVMYLRTLRP